MHSKCFCRSIIIYLIIDCATCIGVPLGWVFSPTPQGRYLKSAALCFFMQQCSFKFKIKYFYISIIILLFYFLSLVWIPMVRGFMVTGVALLGLALLFFVFLISSPKAFRSNVLALILGLSGKLDLLFPSIL